MLKQIYWLLRDLIAGKPLVLGGRSSQWGKLSKQFLKANPYCFCGEKATTTHHVIPFSVDRTRELDVQNLLAVCEHCHIRFAHLGSFRSYEKDIKTIATDWELRRKNRP